MSIYALVDGGCLNNQDPSKREAYGTFLIVEGPNPFDMTAVKEIARQRFDFGNRTNNEAEYLIVKECLLYCMANGIKEIYIATDSQLVWCQMHGTFKVQDKKLKPLYSEIKALITNFQTVYLTRMDRKTMVFYLGH